MTKIKQYKEQKIVNDNKNSKNVSDSKKQKQYD